MATRPTGTSGVALRLAAAAQAAEAVGMGVAAVFAAVSTADGQSYQQASGIALTLIAFGTAAALAALAGGLGLARAVARRRRLGRPVPPAQRPPPHPPARPPSQPRPRSGAARQARQVS